MTVPCPPSNGMTNINHMTAGVPWWVFWRNFIQISVMKLEMNAIKLLKKNREITFHCTVAISNIVDMVKLWTCRGPDLGLF